MPGSTPTKTSAAVITAAEPQLFVADIEVACAFYRDKLGFRVAFVYGEPAYYGQVTRDGARLNLRCATPPVIDPGRRDAQELLSGSLTVATLADILALADEFQQAGVTFAQPLQEKPWSARDFIIRDPDGNLVLLAGPAK